MPAHLNALHILIVPIKFCLKLEFSQIRF